MRALVWSYTNRRSKKQCLRQEPCEVNFAPSSDYCMHEFFCITCIKFKCMCCIKFTINYRLCLGLLGRGPESKISESMEAPPLQFPRMVPHVFDMTRNACVFLTNSEDDGFPLALPRWRCCPKKLSNGSWQILLLRNTPTPGIVKSYWTSSTNAITEEKKASVQFLIDA